MLKVNKTNGSDIESDNVSRAHRGQHENLDNFVYFHRNLEFQRTHRKLQFRKVRSGNQKERATSTNQ